MIIDSFTFFNELDILEIRLNELNDIVDYFILVEATKTQSLIDKPLYFEENKKRFHKFLNKIIHIKVSKIPNIENAWTFENYQRSCIGVGLEHLQVSKDDILLLSDVDEIPKSEILKLSFNSNEEYLVCQMMYNVYYLNLNAFTIPWNGTAIIKGGLVLENIKNIHPLIKRRDNIGEDKKIKNAGWHFGYQGGSEMVFKKYFSCVEPFSKNGIPDKPVFQSLFQSRAKDGGSFIFSDNIGKTDIPLKKVEITSLPKYIQQNSSSFLSQLI